MFILLKGGFALGALKSAHKDNEMQSENTSLSTEWCGKSSRDTAACSFACVLAFEWNTMRLQEPKNENKTSLEKGLMQKLIWPLWQC